MLGLRHLSLTLASLAVLAACNDNDDSTGLGGTAVVRLANATNTSLDFATTGTVGTGSSAILFGGAGTCTTVNALAPDIDVRQAGTSNSLSANYTPTFTPGNNYIVVAHTGFNGVTQFATILTSVPPAAGQAGLRVANLAAGSGPFDVYATAPGAALGTTANATNIGFGAVTGVISLPAGATLVRLTNAGTQTVAVNAGNATLVAGQNTVLVIAPPAAGTTALRAFYVQGC